MWGVQGHFIHSYYNLKTKQLINRSVIRLIDQCVFWPQLWLRNWTPSSSCLFSKMEEELSGRHFDSDDVVITEQFYPQTWSTSCRISRSLLLRTHTDQSVWSVWSISPHVSDILAADAADVVVCVRTSSFSSSCCVWAADKTWETARYLTWASCLQLFTAVYRCWDDVPLSDFSFSSDS